MSGSGAPSRIAEALEGIRGRVARAGGRDVTIVAVTKGFDAATVSAAIAAGCEHLGENYTREVVEKAAALRPAEGPRPVVHFIGALQTNKVRATSGLVDVYETVDRSSLVRELARRVPGARVLVQVNSTGEAAKSGCAPADTERLVDDCRDHGLDVIGLMTVGPTAAPPSAAAPGFRVVRGLVDALGLDVCSMGMSDDLEVAIDAGSTEIRIGTALFGARPARRV